MLRATLAAAALLCAVSIVNAETCRASWYGEAHHGRTMANGKPFDMTERTAAHRSWPFGTLVRVTYRGRSVVVTITDRGPYAGGRCIDLSRAAAASIGMLGAGVGTVTLHRIN